VPHTRWRREPLQHAEGQTRLNTEPEGWTLAHTEKCDARKIKHWALATLTADQVVDVSLKTVSEQLNVKDCPLLQILTAHQRPSTDKHKPKITPSVQRPRLPTFEKAGGQAQKLVETVEDLTKVCEYYANLEARMPIHHRAAQSSREGIGQDGATAAEAVTYEQTYRHALGPRQVHGLRRERSHCEPQQNTP
jgi:hypothetical protein